MQWQCLQGLHSAFRTRRRDGLTTTAVAAVWLLEGAGAIFQHLLTASTRTCTVRVTYDQSDF
jgi:hypothetical protein